MANPTNPNRVVKVSQLNYFKGKADALYQKKAISLTGITAETVEGALTELLGKINALPSAIIPKGSKAFAGLAPSTDLVAGCLGWMWNITDAFTTTSDFAEGTGHSIPAGANVYVANVGTAAEPSYKYDIFQGMYDLSGYALKSEMSVEAGTGANADKTTITLKSGLSATVLTTHQDISGKADKVASATSGNFAGLDGNGNLTDSGSKAADFATAAQGTKADNAVSDVKVKIGTGAAASIVTTNVAELDVAEGATDGTISIAGSDVAVHGLGGAAYKAADYYEPAVTYATDSDIDEMFA